MYLNIEALKDFGINVYNLTLTRVVFEFKTSDGILRPAPKLTLTRVVFEYAYVKVMQTMVKLI